MPRLKCPQCATVFQPAEGQAPQCPGCGYSTQQTAPSFSQSGVGITAPPGQTAPPSASGFQDVAATKTNGLAVAALVLGIIGIPLMMMVLPGLLALVFGIVGVQQTSSKGQAGKGMAIAGIVLGAIAVGLSAFFWTMAAMFGF